MAKLQNIQNYVKREQRKQKIMNWLNPIKQNGLYVAIAVAVLSFFWLTFEWTVNRIYVPNNCSLQLRYKGPLLFGKKVYAVPGQFAKDGEIGILEQMKGPGRHFYCPIWWERKIIDHEGLGRGDMDFKTIVLPGEVACATSSLGDPLPEGEYLVDGDLGTTKHKGILRKVFGPGFYRVNPYQYKFEIVSHGTIQKENQTKHFGWVNVPIGYVGVVTVLADDVANGIKKGIQNDVLQPGIYLINGKEKEVDIVEIGFRESTFKVVKKLNEAGEPIVDEAGEPIIENSGKGINFPSEEGFPINIDFTAIWGIMPDQAATVIKTFGNVEAVEEKVIVPQTESICRNIGSEYSAESLLIGSDRAAFQKEISTEFKEVVEKKNITLFQGLVRAIYIPQEVRLPIQTKFIADELKLTRDQEQQTAKEEAKLREVEKSVDLARKTIETETAIMVQEIIATGEKETGEIQAETRKLVSEIEKEAVALEAEAKVKLGEATATAEKLNKEATAEKFKLAVETFRTPNAYNKYSFATNLPNNLVLKFIPVGEGTLWMNTDFGKPQPTIPLRSSK